MNSYDDHRQVRGGIRSVRALRRVRMSSAMLAAFIACALVARPSIGQSVIVPPKADLDQVRNGTAASPNNPGAWVNGNAGASNSHYVEGYSIPYRVVMTDLLVGTPVTIELGYDIKHSSKHAIDYMTQYERLNDPVHTITFSPSHGPEDIDPTDGVAGESEPPDATYAIPPPSSAGSPVPGEPTANFNSLPAAARVMSIWNATFAGSTGAPISNDCAVLLGGGCVKYVSEGDLNTAQSETRFRVTFTPTSSTVILAWGGHIATGTLWGAGNSAGGISGAPYHTRLEAWSIGSLGNQDRSLSADAVECFCCNTICNDNNSCTSDSCNEATNACVFTPLALSTPCSADANLCTIDHCNGAGACVTFNNVVCQAPNPPCEGGEVCNPSTGLCQAQPDALLSTPCQADANLCTNDHCNGTGSCVFLSNVTCQAPVPPCEGGSTCNPATGLCVANPDAVLSTPCQADGSLCTIDHCNGAGVCVFFHNVTCQAADPPCEGGETCVAGICQPNPDAVLSTPCEADGDLCTNDHCDGGGLCVFLSDVTCQPADPPCEGGEVCVAGICVAQPDAQLSTPCEADGDLCTNDHCNGSGSCVFKDDVVCPADTQCATYDCNPGTGVCDVTYMVLSTVCERDGNKCTNDHCDGGGNCVFLSPVICAGGVGVCEAGQRCDPADGLCKNLPDAPFSTPCEDDMNFCTIEHCDGNGFCVFLRNVTCAPAVPPCEGGEYCEPTTGACLDNPDAVLSTPCQADPNLCTIDHCNGSGTCVTFDFVDCADPVPPCEAGAHCEPSTGMCVDNPDAALSTPCQADMDLCTNDHCDGLGNCVLLNIKPCPGPVPPCEAGEQCNPSSGLCKPLTDAPLSTPCQADGTLCTVDHCNGQGLCVFLRDVLCQLPNPPCEGGAVCNPSTGLCVAQPDAVLSTPCQADGTLCTNDHCDGLGNCVFLSLRTCPGPVPPCEAGALCDPMTGLCVAQTDAALSTPCEAENPPNLCTNDHCNGEGLCVFLVCKPPGITCPPNKIFECDAVGDFGDPTVVDNCSVLPTVECTEDSTPGKLPQERTIIRTCTVTNDCGNTAQCEQRIDIVDTTPPVVTCPPDCTLECGDVQCVPPECDDPSCECGGVATCVDNCSTCTVSVTCEVVPKGCIAGQVAGLTPPPKLTVVRTFSATEATAAVTATGQGNIGRCVQHIELVDTTPPVLVADNCPGTITICRYAELSFTPPTCTDTCGTCGVICVRSDNLPFPGPPASGPITVTCVASDECGNESSCTIDVELSDAGECFIKIPTVSEWGLVILTLLLLTGAKVFFGRRQVEVA